MAIPGSFPGTLVSGQILLDGVNLAAMKEEELNKSGGEESPSFPRGHELLYPGSHRGWHVEVLSVHLGLSKKESADRTGVLFEMAGLEAELAGRYPHELSGGQKQRAAIALALACGPDYLLCDEPTTALDVVTQRGIIATLKDLAEKQGVGLLLVSHDLPLAASAASRLYIMKDGRLVEEGEPGAIVSSPRNPHTRALVRALLDLEEDS